MLCLLWKLTLRSSAFVAAALAVDGYSPPCQLLIGIWQVQFGDAENE